MTYTERLFGMIEPTPLQPIVEEIAEDLDRCMALDSSFDDAELFDSLAQDICTLVEDSERRIALSARLLYSLLNEERPYSPETTERFEEEDEGSDYEGFEYVDEDEQD